jgi:hypothetical protein
MPHIQQCATASNIDSGHLFSVRRAKWVGLYKLKLPDTYAYDLLREYLKAADYILVWIHPYTKERRKDNAWNSQDTPRRVINIKSVEDTGSSSEDDSNGSGRDPDWQQNDEVKDGAGSSSEALVDWRRAPPVLQRSAPPCIYNDAFRSPATDPIKPPDFRKYQPSCHDAPPSP